MTIENCSVYAEGTYGIKGVANESGQVVTVRNAHVEAYAKAAQCVKSLDSCLMAATSVLPRMLHSTQCCRALQSMAFGETNVVIAPDENMALW